LAISAIALGVVAVWTTDDPVRLDGLQGPNNGWLVLIVAAFAAAWIRSMSRGSWVGIAAVLGASIVILWTGIATWLDNRDVGASGSYGLYLVISAGVLLAGAAVARGLALSRAGARKRPHA
jgi:hypothetical protein